MHDRNSYELIDFVLFICFIYFQYLSKFLTDYFTTVQTLYVKSHMPALPAPYGTKIGDVHRRANRINE